MLTFDGNQKVDCEIENREKIAQKKMFEKSSKMHPVSVIHVSSDFI